MTSVDPLRPALGGLPGRAAAAAALTLLLAGCAAATARVPLPAKPPAAPSAPPTGAVPSQRMQVIAALTGYTDALSEADKARNGLAARQLLQPYLAASRIAGIVQTVTSIWARGEVFFGQDILHVLSVTISGQSAVVHDCDDTSGMGLDYLSTGQLVPGSAGIRELNIVTDLALVGGHWLVQSQLIEDVPCTP